MRQFLFLFWASLFAVPLEAALIDRGGGFIYDDVQDITWTQDANINGLLDTWDNQVEWVDALSIFDSVRGVTHDDWRLSATMQPDLDCSQNSDTPDFPLQWYGYNCTNSEMGYLYNVYGITPSSPGPFTNIQSEGYWSETDFEPVPLNAWFLNFGIGYQFIGGKPDNNFAAWAVRDGDVAAIPVPAAVWLFGSALGLLG